jgi:phage/plasmid primase-like uncharacterized protein
LKNEIERAKDALFSLDASCNRDEWVTIGMAAKSAKLSFDDFNQWSTTGNNYVSEKDCLNTWKSFKNNGGISAATLFKYALDRGWKNDAYIKSKSSDNLNSKAKQTKQNDETKRTVAVDAKFNATNIWELCIAADLDHGYISHKKGNTEGIRIYPSTAPILNIGGQNIGGYLAVPCWSDGVLQTLQFIPGKEGKKLNLPGGSFNDGYFTVGKITDTVYICEGIGQAWACASATGKAGVVCFGAGRIKTVAENIHKQYPTCHLVLVPDKGKESQAESITSHVVGSFVKMPADRPSNYDANDFSTEFGYEALTDLLENQRQSPTMRFKLLSGADLYNAPAMKWLIRGLLPRTGLAALYGPSGCGKSFLMLDIACALAGGHHD